MSLWYRTGTISITNGTSALTGVGTAWVANVSPGMMVIFDRQIIGEVQSVNSNTSITLATAYAGTTISGGAYAIANLGAVRDGLIAAVNDALAAFQAEQDGPLSGRFGDGTLAEPGLAFLADLNTGFRRPAADQIGIVTGGVQRALLSSAAMQVDVPVTGTAVQSSVTDTTAGRLMKVRAFGLGATVQQPTLADVDALTTASGLYRATGTSAGVFPVGASKFGVMLVERYSSDRISQTYRPNLTGINYIRVYDSTVWQPWRRVYSEHSILGTVSQSGGVPTGAVIERGNNANGRYIRFADGTQICTGTLTSDGAADTVWTYPAAFAGVDGVAFAPLSGAARIANPTSTGIATTTLTFNVFNLSGSRSAASTAMFAVGRWF